MIKCILVDDELPAIQYLRTLIDSLPDVEIVKSFNNAAKCIREMNDLDFNTCLLDIHMPGMSGLELAQHLSNKAIIFSTAHKEFAAEAFDLDAVDYLRKPYQLDRLKIALEKAKFWLEKQSSFKGIEIELNTALGKSRIQAAHIRYIEVAEHDRRDKYIYLLNGSNILAKNISLDELLSILPKNEFAQINRKTLLNLAQVGSYTSQLIHCKPLDEKETPQLSLSSAYRVDFLKALSTQYNF